MNMSIFTIKQPNRRQGRKVYLKQKIVVGRKVVTRTGTNTWVVQGDKT